MLDAQFTCCAGKGLATVGTEYNIFRQERFQRNRLRCYIHCLQHTIHRCTGTIKSNQNRHLFVREAALGGPPRAFVPCDPNRSAFP